MGDEVTSVAASDVAKSADTPFPHDVFISYSHKDGPWVQDEFVPQLRGAGLDVLIDADFTIGKPSVLNMTNAVRDSRYIVAVLTQNWLESEWSGFEGYLVTTADPVGNQTRLLPLMLEQCKPPPHIAFLTFADFTQPSRRADEMKRLLHAMQAHDEVTQALPVRTAYASDYARDGLAALVDLIKVPEVRDTVIEFKTVFKGTRRQMEVLYNYKDLHDQLHDIETRCFQPLINEQSYFPDDADTVEHMTEAKLILEDDLVRVTAIIARANYLAIQGPGLKPLEQALTLLDQAITGSDAKLLSRAAEKMKNVIAQQPARINGKLLAAAESLRLDDLIQAMRAISERLQPLVANKSKLKQFLDGVRGLELLHSALTGLISEHDLWQQVDNKFHLIASDPEEDLSSFAEACDELHDLAAPLYEKKLELWAERYRALEQNLLKAIKDGNPAEAGKQFRFLRSRALSQFVNVDNALKRACENLREIGEPLATVLDLL